MKRTVLLAAAMVWFAAVSPVDAHYFLGNDSVDSGEIRYEDNTGYDTEKSHAVNSWNAYEPIDVEPDDPWHVQDLRWNTHNDCNDTWAGLWVPSSGSDDIYLNQCTFDNADPVYTQFQRSGTAAHELGHALGLAHNTGQSNQLMYMCSRCSGFNTPQSHDVQDYHELWGF